MRGYGVVRRGRGLTGAAVRGQAMLVHINAHISAAFLGPADEALDALVEGQGGVFEVVLGLTRVVHAHALGRVPQDQERAAQLDQIGRAHV